MLYVVGLGETDGVGSSGSVVGSSVGLGDGVVSFNVVVAASLVIPLYDLNAATTL